MEEAQLRRARAFLFALTVSSIGSLGLSPLGYGQGNPKEKAFDAPADDVFKAAKTAAAGHRILIPQDEGLKTLTDSGEEIKTFKFAVSLPGLTLRVIEEISVEPLPDGTSTLKVFFHKDRGALPYVPSASYDLREQQLQNKLERKLSALEAEEEQYRIQYEVIHSIDLETYINKKKEITKAEEEAKLEEINQQHDAQIDDLAGIPTSSFSAMDAAADKFFALVQQNLTGGKAKTSPAVSTPKETTPSDPAAQKAVRLGTASVIVTSATNPAGTPTAIIDTTVGKITCTLFPDQAPIGVKNFIGLATGTKDWKNPVSGVSKHGVPLYDGTIFHRVIPGFMIQGGDPKGDGTGQPGYEFKNEVSSDLLFDKPGRLAFANSGPDTNESQFFITEAATPHLNGNYTIFGQCDEASVALVKQIAHMATNPSNDRPFSPVKIIHITIVRGAAAPAKPVTSAVDRSSSRGNKETDAAALKAVREEWIKNTQKELWRQGMEMTVQARGTTLYVKYVLAGDAFAFQFGETFLGQNGGTLKALGFKKVYLSNGETGWTWDLAGY